MIKSYISTPFLLFFSLFLLNSCGLFEEEKIIPEIEEEEEEQEEINHLLLGNPSDAQEDILMLDNYLLSKEEFALSYNSSRGIPNWVSWHLSEYWLGSVGRTDFFNADNSLPDGATIVSYSDYSGSGFDRGHNCPSADRTRTREENEATFLMTNVIPQAPENNQKLWNEMEMFSRSQVRNQGKELYIIMGNYGEGGTGRFGTEKRIGPDGMVTVPKYVWKVMVIIEDGNDDLLRINEDTRVIAVLTPNVNNGLKDWGEYRVSVDEIEKETGLDLLSEVPVEIQEVLEAKVDDGPV